MGSNHSGSTGTPSQGTPNFRRPSFLQQRERLYRAGPGKYVVIQDVESQQRGDLTLRKGMTIDGKNNILSHNSHSSDLEIKLCIELFIGCGLIWWVV